MNPNQIAGTFDIAQLLMIVFIGGFWALVIYIRREDKREGYPLEDPAADFQPGRRRLIGFPEPPPPKLFPLMSGEVAVMPHPEGRTALPLALGPFPGAPYTPIGDAMQAGVGPASYASKKNEPLLTWEGQPQLRPLRSIPRWHVDPADPDPRGMPVLDADGIRVGTVSDLWLDEGVKILRYLEIALTLPADLPRDPLLRAIVPIYFADISAGGIVRVPALYARHFAAYPQIHAPDTITALEEDRVSAFCQGGLFYGDPRRSEPFY